MCVSHPRLGRHSLQSGVAAGRPQGLWDRTCQQTICIRTKAASFSTTPVSTTIGKPSTSETPMKILVTGGAGFIGSAFVRLVVAETGWEVVNLDKLTYAGNLENLAEVESSGRYRFVQGGR